MVNIPYELIVEKIQQTTQISKEDIEKRINQKLAELSGLLSPQGAAHIIANELGVQLVPQAGQVIEIKDILEGMQQITLNAKVIQKFPTHTFNEGKGQVCSMLLGDSSGKIRATFWHDAIKEIEQVEPNHIVQIKNTYAKTNQGRVELHANNRTKVLINPKGVSIEDIPDSTSIEKKSWIKDLQIGHQSTLTGVIVQAFKPIFYEICKECSRRTNKCTCQTPTPTWGYVITIVLDDSTQTMRSTMFRQQVLDLLELSDQELTSLREQPDELEHIKQKLLGKLIQLQGKTVHNTMFERTEFMVNQVHTKLNIEKEIELLTAK